MTKKRFAKIILFFLILAFLIAGLTRILVLKEYPVGPNVNALLSPYVLCEKQDGFYSLQEDTLDVVYIGSSNVHCNINPNVIWDAYGITGYDFCSDQQELGTSCYYLQQVFETQSPKVVVVDVLGNGDMDAIDTATAHYAFDHMKNDVHKAAAIYNRTQDDRLEMYLPIIAYHERWKELTQDDYLYRPNTHNPLQGAFIYMVQNAQEEPQIPDTIPEYQLSWRTRRWLDSIRELCAAHDCRVLFIKTPFAFYDEGMFAYFNAVGDYCEENGLPFLNMNYCAEEIGLDYSTDYADNMHLNWAGQWKLSQYLGAYLAENYHLENKKGQAEYAIWDEDCDTMMYYVKDFWNLYAKSLADDAVQ